MPTRKILLSLLIVLALLSPLALLLRTQNPWNCFGLTSDESYFTTAIYNWENGNSYRRPEEPKPFDPGINVGVPMAWGASAMQKVTGYSLAQSARAWVHFCFYILLLLLAGVSLRRSRSWAAPLITVALFSIGLSKVPMGPYLVYGVLGEVPALLIACLALFALDANHLVLAGALSVFAYFCKMTDALLTPAIVLSSLISYRWKGLRTMASSALSLLMIFVVIGHLRGESVFEYVRVLLNAAIAIGLTVPGSVLDYYRDVGAVPILMSLLIVAHAFYGLMPTRKEARLRKKIDPSELGAFLFLLAAVIVYLISQKRPSNKHWTVFYSAALAMVSVQVGVKLGPRLSALLPDQVLKPVLITAVLIWLVNVPVLEKAKFNGKPDNACPLKEQDYINQFFHRLAIAGQIRKADVGFLVHNLDYSYFVYVLGWQPDYFDSWNKLAKPLPKWVVGEIEILQPVPAGCHAYWMGSQFGILKC